MIQAESDRCGYCGACVGVCPVGAIELAETRLLISEACFDCGLCLAACPVGALKAGDHAETGVAPLRRRYDVVVVGAGPGGSVSAREAARRGLSVLLLEKRQEIGSPVRCAEGVTHDLLAPFIESQSYLAQGSPVTLVVGGVPVAPPLPRLVANGLMLAGDAARQVDPLTGGGIANAMMAGRLAAEAAAQAIAAGDTSAEALASYEDRWMASRGRKMARNYRLKERFGPGERSSADFLRVFAVAVGGI